MTASDGGVAAYQGVPGAFSEQAAWQLAGREATLLPCATLADVSNAVASGRATQAIVPIENSLAGTVPHAYSLLLDHGLAAVAETRVRIDHMVIGTPAARLDHVRRVRSHPVALDQCRRFITARGLATDAAFDTAGAVADVIACGDPSVAAIASRRAAEIHGGRILAECVQDHPDNWTRFLRLVPRAVAPPLCGRKAIAHFRLPHAPGALGRALMALAAGGLNLTKIDSRPIADRPFEYAFVIELEAAGSRHWADVIALLASLAVDPQLVAAYDAG